MGLLAASASETITFYALTVISSAQKVNLGIRLLWRVINYRKRTKKDPFRPILIFFIRSRAIFTKLNFVLIFVQKVKKVKIFVFKQILYIYIYITYQW